MARFAAASWIAEAVDVGTETAWIYQLRVARGTGERITYNGEEPLGACEILDCGTDEPGMVIVGDHVEVSWPALRASVQRPGHTKSGRWELTAMNSVKMGCVTGKA
jgi:hypothetical protein